MVSSANEIKTIDLRKFGRAFIIGAFVDFLRRLIEPAIGPFDLFVIPFYALFYTFIFIALVAALGLIFEIKPVKTYWFKSKFPCMVAMIVGAGCFLYGTISAHHTYFVHQNARGADEILVFFARPGFLIFLFALCFKPSIQNANHKQEEESSNPALDESKTIFPVRISYKCEGGELIIEQKEEKPSSDDAAYLNGNPAPSGKYKISENQTVFISNGIVYALRNKNSE